MHFNVKDIFIYRSQNKTKAEIMKHIPYYLCNYTSKLQQTFQCLRIFLNKLKNSISVRQALSRCFVKIAINYKELTGTVKNGTLNLIIETNKRFFEITV